MEFMDMDLDLEQRARAMLKKMNQDNGTSNNGTSNNGTSHTSNTSHTNDKERLWRWALRGIVIQ